MSRLLASLVFQDIKIGTGIVKVNDQISRVLYTSSRCSKINKNKIYYSYKSLVLNSCVKSMIHSFEILNVLKDKIVFLLQIYK